MAVPTFTLDIEKTYAGETWTNRYLLDNSSIESALLTAQAVVDAEIPIHTVDVVFTRYRVSDINPGTDIFVIVPLGDTGGNAKVTGYLPLFNVARVDFFAGIGRPSRKYLRLPFQEMQVEEEIIQAGLLAQLTTYGNAIGDIDNVVDPDGVSLGSGVPLARVAMRQLRRGSKRRATPVLG